MINILKCFPRYKYDKYFEMFPCKYLSDFLSVKVFSAFLSD